MYMWKKNYKINRRKNIVVLMTQKNKKKFLISIVEELLWCSSHFTFKKKIYKFYPPNYCICIFSYKLTKKNSIQIKFDKFLEFKVHL